MKGTFKKVFVVLAVSFGLIAMLVPYGYSEGIKLGYVDLRKAFYEYEKTKNLEKDLNSLTQTSQEQRTEKVQEITKLRGEEELLSGDAKANKQREIDAKLADLQAFDRETRQTLLNKRNDMFREVIDDIQKIVEGLGKKEKYDYILDSRNIMYSNTQYDLTEEVVKQLNR